MHKIKQGALTEGTVKRNFKKTLEKLFASDNVFSFISSINGKPTYWKHFYMMHKLWLSN